MKRSGIHHYNDSREGYFRVNFSVVRTEDSLAEAIDEVRPSSSGFLYGVLIPLYEPFVLNSDVL